MLIVRNWLTNNFFTKIFKMILWRRRMQYWQPRQNIVNDRLEHFFSMSGKDEKLFPQIFFLQMFIWTRNLQSWQHFSKDSSQKAEIVFGQFPIHIWKKLGKNSNSKCFPRNVAYNFSNAKQISNSRKRAQYLRSLSEFQKTCSFPDKKQSYSKCLSRHRECSFDKRAKKLSQELKRVLLNVRKSMIEKSSFLQKKSTPTGYLET